MNEQLYAGKRWPLFMNTQLHSELVSVAGNLFIAAPNSPMVMAFTKGADYILKIVDRETSRFGYELCWQNRDDLLKRLCLTPVAPQEITRAEFERSCREEADRIYGPKT